MSKRFLVVVLMVVVTGAAVYSAGCVRVPLTESQKVLGGEQGESSTETTSAPLGGATRVDVTIRMGVGELLVSSVPSSTAAFTADFSYSPPSWKPEVAYHVRPTDAGQIGVLYVGQPETGNVTKWGQTENSWELALASGVPTDLTLKVGVGEATVDLEDVDVRSIDVVAGVGETKIDLSGPRSNDVSGTVTSGVGATTLLLPRDVGVMITGGGGGLGKVSSEDFTRTGDVLTNDAWNQPGPKITLKVVRGVGDLTFALVK